MRPSSCQTTCARSQLAYALIAVMQATVRLRPPEVNSLKTRLTTLLPVGGRLLDKPPEEGFVLALLGVPEHAEREALRRVLDGLQRPVVRPGRLAQAAADAAEALVVVGLHRRAVADQRAEPARGIDPHAVRREDAGRLAVLLVADHLRQVLDEVASAGDVQDLAPAADGEHGHIARQGAFQQGELGPVAFGLNTGSSAVGVGAIGPRVHVVPAG